MFDQGFDPIEVGPREWVRGFVETVLETVLKDAPCHALLEPNSDRNASMLAVPRGNAYVLAMLAAMLTSGALAVSMEVSGSRWIRKLSRRNSSKGVEERDSPRLPWPCAF